MNPLTQDIAILLVRELHGLQRELHLFPDDASIWRTAPGVTNSSANLALHVAGNLQHYVGTVLGGTGYVRDRSDEFGRQSGSRTELAAELATAGEVVQRVLGELPAQQLDFPYPGALAAGVEPTTRRFLLHLCAHAAFHLGQAGYLRRLATGSNVSSGPVPLAELAGSLSPTSEPTPIDLHARVDPELRPILAATPPFGDITADPPATRAMLSEMLGKAAPAQPEGAVQQEDRRIPGSPGSPEVPVRIYRPAGTGSTSGRLLWIHGGGLLLGDLNQDDALCRRIVDRTGCSVVSVDYRLAPEHPFPAGVEDCYAALQWLDSAAAEGGDAPGRLVVGGASAGGCLAASVAQMARDRGGPSIALQLLIYPMLDDRHTSPSSRVVTDPRVWNRANSVRAWAAYLAGRKEVPPHAAPARATDLGGLPPAYLLVADLDLLRDENLDYAQRLIAVGVPTEVHLYPQTIHGFDVIAPSAAVSRRATDDYLDALKRAFAE